MILFSLFFLIATVAASQPKDGARGVTPKSRDGGAMYRPSMKPVRVPVRSPGGHEEGESDEAGERKEDTVSGASSEGIHDDRKSSHALKGTTPCGCCTDSLCCLRADEIVDSTECTHTCWPLSCPCLVCAHEMRPLFGAPVAIDSFATFKSNDRLKQLFAYELCRAQLIAHGWADPVGAWAMPERLQELTASNRGELLDVFLCGHILVPLLTHIKGCGVVFLDGRFFASFSASRAAREPFIEQLAAAKNLIHHLRESVLFFQIAPLQTVKGRYSIPRDHIHPGGVSRLELAPHKIIDFEAELETLLTALANLFALRE